MDPTMYEAAVRFTMGVLRRASDWQEGEFALANHSRFGPWLESEMADADYWHSLAQAIIRDAEDRLGDQLPHGYGD